MKRLLCLTMALCMALTLAVGSFAQEDEEHFTLTDYSLVYGYELPASTTATSLSEEVTTPLTVAGVQVTLGQVVYDGVWVLTSAVAIPENPREVVLMPGSSSVGDKYAGMYDEGVRPETGSFLDVAKQQNKRLLAVYAYPKEFDEQDAYFMDHLQDSGDRSLLVAGCDFGMPSETPLSLHWMVQVYEVDVATQAYTLLEEKLLPLTLQPMPSTATAYATAGGSTPLTGCTLLRTALTTYVFPQWKDGTDPYAYGITPLDDAGNPYDIELPWATNSYAIATPPTTLTLQVENFEAGSLSTVPLTQR